MQQNTLDSLIKIGGGKVLVPGLLVLSSQENDVAFTEAELRVLRATMIHLNWEEGSLNTCPRVGLKKLRPDCIVDARQEDPTATKIKHYQYKDQGNIKATFSIGQIGVVSKTLFEAVRMTANQLYTMHIHKKTNARFVILKGTGHAMIGGSDGKEPRCIPYGPGSVMEAKMGEPHGFYPTSDTFFIVCEHNPIVCTKINAHGPTVDFIQCNPQPPLPAIVATAARRGVWARGKLSAIKRAKSRTI